MADLLRAEQVILLDNLMYMSGDRGPFTLVVNSKGMTVGAYVDQQLHALSQREVPPDQARTFGVLTAIRHDPVLCGMVIADTRVESLEDGRGASAMFINPVTQEAVICYRGTGREEWRDNFFGGTVTSSEDGVSTAYQKAALRTYRHYVSQLRPEYTITVSGHSKGGNKAKYITILDDTVDRCISCDGQGFSDEFIAAYKPAIQARKHKITNHNVDDDFVNLLLNDVGVMLFYRNNRGKNNPIQNHCADAFFHFDGQGGYTVSRTRRPFEVKQMDAYLNSLIRSMPQAQRAGTLAMFGDFATLVFGSGQKLRREDLITLFASDVNKDHISYLVSFTIRYGQEHMEFGLSLGSYLARNGLRSVNKTISGIQNVMGSEWLGWIMRHNGLIYRRIGVIWLFIPERVKGKLLIYVKDQVGVELSQKQVITLAKRLLMGMRNVNSIESLPAGEDIDAEALCEYRDAPGRKRRMIDMIN